MAAKVMVPRTTTITGSPSVSLPDHPEFLVQLNGNFLLQNTQMIAFLNFWKKGL